ncbi:hypothetical protein [Neorhizobium petrolearium]|uniref:hypothetical protein n=1 Tax=Neorhizobium petrolearium TaxID=515361 RepID=UPI003F7D2F03
MIAAWVSKAATPLIKILIVFAIGAGFSLGATYFGYRIAEKITEIIVDRVTAAVTERDAHWKGQIAEANLKVALAQAAQANEAMRLNTELAAAQEDARQAQEDLKNANAALPGGDTGGLDAQRVQLLNRR